VCLWLILNPTTCMTHTRSSNFALDRSLCIFNYIILIPAAAQGILFPLIWQTIWAIKQHYAHFFHVIWAGKQFVGVFRFLQRFERCILFFSNKTPCSKWHAMQDTTVYGVTCPHTASSIDHGSLHLYLWYRT
jgi:hypothetical protein